MSATSRVQCRSIRDRIAKKDRALQTPGRGRAASVVHQRRIDRHEGEDNDGVFASHGTDDPRYGSASARSPREREARATGIMPVAGPGRRSAGSPRERRPEPLGIMPVVGRRRSAGSPRERRPVPLAPMPVVGPRRSRWHLQAVHALELGLGPRPRAEARATCTCHSASCQGPVVPGGAAFGDQRVRAIVPASGAARRARRATWHHAGGRPRRRAVQLLAVGASARHPPGRATGDRALVSTSTQGIDRFV
jgi:hypothetical protein